MSICFCLLDIRGFLCSTRQWQYAILVQEMQKPRGLFILIMICTLLSCQDYSLINCSWTRTCMGNVTAAHAARCVILYTVNVHILNWGLLYVVIILVYTFEMCLVYVESEKRTNCHYLNSYYFNKTCMLGALLQPWVGCKVC